MEHTPGPWMVRRHVSGPLADIYSIDHCDCLATTAFHGWTFEEMEANARLIAAAPDLLAALHDARLLLTMIAKETYQGDDWAERDESIRGCLMGIDAAIAKAKGE